MFSYFTSYQNKQDNSSSASSASAIKSESGPRSRKAFHSQYHNKTRDEDAHLEQVQQGFLGGYRDKNANPTPKSLFRGVTGAAKNTHSQHPHYDRSNSDSNSSTEGSHSRRVDVMMASPALPPRNTSSREKQRRRTRSSRRTSGSSNSGLSQPLLMHGYGENCDYDEAQSPVVARRKSSKMSAPILPAQERRFSVQDSKRQTIQSHDEHSMEKPHHSDYYSPELSSESSPDSSPSRHISDMYRLQQYQHDDTPKHGRQLSSSRLSWSSMRSSSRSSNDSSTGYSASYNPKLNSMSPTNKITPLRNPKSPKPRANANNKTRSLAGTFLGIIVLCLSGMILLTRRAVPMQKDITLLNLPDDSSLRGKQVLGRMWDTSATNSEDTSSIKESRGSKQKVKKTASTSKKSQVSSSRKDSGSSSGKLDSKKTVSTTKKSQDSSSKNGSVSSSGQSESKTVSTTKSQYPSSKKSSISNSGQFETKKTPDRKATAPPHRLQMRVPPSMSSKKREPKFDTVDRYLYYPSSISKNGTKADFLPRTVMLDPSVKRVSRKIKKYPADFTDSTQLYGILASDDERLRKMEMRDPYSTNECVPMQEWQTAYQPSCNGMHELALQTLGASKTSLEEKSSKRLEGLGLEGLNATLFGTKGFWRYAWKLVINHHDHKRAEEDTIVFKNLKYEHNFEDAHFEHDRIDAIAMERLTSSPHVINIFGFCGHSVMTEYADGKRLGELADKSKKAPLKRLEIARDIANGLADVHGIDGDGNTTFVHLDVNPANVVSVNETLKLNDFNIGIIRQWNMTSNEACGFPTQYPNPQWRSPEEARNEQHLTEKVDVFSLGHIFFRLICGHEPWNKLEPGGRPTKAEINEKVQRGELPFIPDHVRNSDDPEIIAIRDIMIKCYSFDPTERPSARYIATALEHTLNDLIRNHTSNTSKIKKTETTTSSAVASSK